MLKLTIDTARNQIRQSLDNSQGYPAIILYKFIAGRYRPVRVADGPITARYTFIKNDYWVATTG